MKIPQYQILDLFHYSQGHSMLWVMDVRSCRNEVDEKCVAVRPIFSTSCCLLLPGDHNAKTDDCKVHLYSIG